MTQNYLFDWGNTLMIDFADESGKMCHWSKVQAMEGAHHTLSILSKVHPIYIATNAADSSVDDIKHAFERVELSCYIDGYFCQANLGIGKGTPEFFLKIAEHLNVKPSSLIMVGDNYENDIAPAITAGLEAIWLNPNSSPLPSEPVIKQITGLSELVTPSSP